MTVWPNGTKSKPDISTGWLGYPNHHGTDFVNFDYNCATDAGRVVYADWNSSGAGYEVRIEHANYISRYLHNKPNLLVVFGQSVGESQAIGVQGDTGDATGKHLHYEVWPEGNINNRTDPVPYLSARVASTAGGGGFKPIQEMELPTMATGYYTSSGRFAIAGDGIGAAAWHEMGTENQTFWTEWVQAHHIGGKGLKMTEGEFAEYRRRYTSPMPVKAV